MGRLIPILFCLCIASSFVSAEQTVAGSSAVKNAFNSYYNYELIRRIAKKCNKNELLEKVDSTILAREIQRVLKIDLVKFYDYLLTVSYNIEFLNQQQKSFDCTNSKHMSHVDSLIQQHRLAIGLLTKNEPLPKPLPKLSYTVGAPKSLADRQIQATLINGLAQAHSVVIGTLVRTETVPKSEQQVYFKHNNHPEFVYRLDRGWNTKLDHYIPAVSNRYSYINESDLNEDYLLFINAPKNSIKTYEVFRSFSISSVEEYLFLLGETDWNW